MKGKQQSRAAAYIRVSDPSQVETHSLDAQRADIQRWCTRHGHELVRVYSEDGLTARSERIDKRPQLVALLADAELGLFDIVVVHMIDRWARNVGVQRQALQRLGEARVGFMSVTEGFDFTTPAGKLMLTMLGGVAEFFSDQLALHVSKAQRYRADLGLPVGPVPFGYVTPDPGGVPQVEPREDEAVREVFLRRANGTSNGEIAASLGARGFRTRKGRRFTAHAVKDMLNTRFYCGVVTYQGEEHPGKHKAIVPEELYLQARRQRRAFRRDVHGARGVLQGMISCLRCGRPLHSDRSPRGSPMYRERHSFDCDTNNRTLVVRSIDRQIGDIVRALMLPEDWRERMVRLAAARGQIVDLSGLLEQRRRLPRAYADGAFSEAEYTARLAQIDGRIHAAQPACLPTVGEAAALFSNLGALWDEATAEEQRRLISPLVERVYIDIESRRIGAITPAPAFRSLLEGALEQSGRSACVLLPADVANQPELWTWWRRGRIELPVQKKATLNILQA